MAFINWNDKLSVQVPSMDHQHQQLIELLNQLYAEMKSGKGQEKMVALLAELINRTREHFSNEEAYMLSIKYPYFAAHKGMHDTLIRKAIDLQNSFQQREPVALQTLLTFLNSWLVNHIEQEDKQYGLHASQSKAAANR